MVQVPPLAQNPSAHGSRGMFIGRNSGRSAFVVGGLVMKTGARRVACSPPPVSTTTFNGTVRFHALMARTHACLHAECHIVLPILCLSNGGAK